MNPSNGVTVGLGEVFTPPGSRVNVKPSVVKTVGVVTDGSDIESVPIMMPLGPRITVSPLGSVIVSSEDRKLKEPPPRRIHLRVEVGAGPAGSRVNVKPSVVRTVGVVTVGKDTVSDPITIPDGPRTTVCPLGSVKVSGELGKLKEETPITMPAGTELCDAGVVESVLELAGTEFCETEDIKRVLELAGSNVKVTSSVVIARGPVADGKLIVSVPMTMPLGPRMIDCPLGSVKVVEVDGNVYVDPLITTSAGVEVTIELEEELD